MTGADIVRIKLGSEMIPYVDIQTFSVCENRVAKVDFRERVP